MCRNESQPLESADQAQQAHARPGVGHNECLYSQLTAAVNGATVLLQFKDYVEAQRPVRAAWQESTQREDVRKRCLSCGELSGLGVHSAHQRQRNQEVLPESAGCDDRFAPWLARCSAADSNGGTSVRNPTLHLRHTYRVIWCVSMRAEPTARSLITSMRGGEQGMDP